MLLSPRFLLLLTFFFFLFSLSQVSCDVVVEVDEEDAFSQTQVVKGPNRRLLPFLDCGGLCKMRCSEHSRPNVCGRACGTCCTRCKCVPPGTFGNRHLCGKCYTDMTTHGNKPKCP